MKSHSNWQVRSGQWGQWAQWALGFDVTLCCDNRICLETCQAMSKVREAQSLCEELDFEERVFQWFFGSFSSQQNRSDTLYL